MVYHKAMQKVTEGLTIPEAAKETGLSQRHIRRLIHEGKLEAELGTAKHGQAYYIKSIPEGIGRYKDKPDGSGLSDEQTLAIVQGQQKQIEELHDQVMRLTYQLGASEERGRNLERQVKLLTTSYARATMPWYKRIFIKKPRVVNHR